MPHELHELTRIRMMVHRLHIAASGRNQRRVEGGKGRRGEDEKKLQITKKMAVILEYLKCFLKEDFQDVTKKFLPKKQEIERLYHRFSLILCLVLVSISPKAFKNTPVGRFFSLEFVILGLWFVCNLYFVICNFISCHLFLPAID